MKKGWGWCVMRGRGADEKCKTKDDGVRFAPRLWIIRTAGIPARPITQFAPTPAESER